MRNKVPVKEFESIALQLAEGALTALDDLLHRQHCFPIIEKERRDLIRNALYCATRTGMLTVARMATQGDDVSAAIVSTFKLPGQKGGPIEPPSPV